MTSPTAGPAPDEGGPDVMAESLASVRESQFSITDPDPSRWGPPSDLDPIPAGIVSDAGNASCIVGNDGVAAMSAREARFQDHQDDVSPQGGSEGDLIPMVMPFHATPGPNLPAD
jgi:hypothetical protein